MIEHEIRKRNWNLTKCKYFLSSVSVMQICNKKINFSHLFFLRRDKRRKKAKTENINYSIIDATVVVVCEGECWYDNYYWLDIGYSPVVTCTLKLIICIGDDGQRRRKKNTFHSNVGEKSTCSLLIITIIIENKTHTHKIMLINITQITFHFKRVISGLLLVLFECKRVKVVKKVVERI